ncbi:endo-1,4-beta-xylanase [Cellulomonas sp. S1-8]|uniref:endo-1,4-beta-xylanase n=1 Tax=Cellulomonas sp. S1-8 TaxID=2904790 RepID=UPI002243AAC7|nr:endo-1,4-beta-xylanase [Cellulomonas sp. S1-8]UZN04205.1 endo-1,4-beta-xylanase [Cellulomonas sp. S1-8]
MLRDNRRWVARWVGAGTAVALAAVGLAVPAQAAVATFDVEITVSGSGTVTGEGSYEAGETVELTATPAASHVWGGWTSAELGWIGARVGSFTMPEGDVVLEASFRKQMASLKNVYRDYFDVGNIYSGPQTYAAGSPNSATVDRHYSVMTAENNMKPDQLLPNNNIDPVTGEFTFTWDAADAFVDETLARGMDVHGHVLVWHGQSPPRINSGATGGTRAQAKANMERYIEAVLTHFSGRTVSWDVVNEAFVDGLAEFDPATQDWRDFLRGGPNGGFSNWYSAYANGADAAAGESPSDFLYDAFVLARQYGPETRLEYNDFNVFQSEGKAQAIIAMATDLNERYAAEHPDDPRQLVESIGLQSHNYINQTPALACTGSRLPQLSDDAAEEWQPGACSDEASVERSLQLIIEAGFTASISELDLQVWEAWNGQPEGDDRSQYRDLTDPTVADRISRGEFDYWVGKITNRAELEAIQAQRFAEYFAVYKKYSTDINRVTFWGITDQLSWRSTHNPLIFNSDFSEKLGAAASAAPERWLGLPKTIVDTSKLELALAQAKALDLRGSVWTGVTLAKVKVAIARVAAVLKAGGPQAKVNAATAALLDAVAALERKK